MADLVVALIGGVIGVFFFYAIWEFVLFKRVFDNPVNGKIASVMAGYLTAGLLGGLGGGPDGWRFFWGAFLTCLPGALIVGVFAYKRGLAIREEASMADDMIEDTFN